MQERFPRRQHEHTHLNKMLLTGNITFISQSVFEATNVTVQAVVTLAFMGKGGKLYAADYPEQQKIFELQTAKEKLLALDYQEYHTTVSTSNCHILQRLADAGRLLHYQQISLSTYGLC